MLDEFLERREIIRGGGHLKQNFVNAGFQDVQETKRTVFIGNWIGGLFISLKLQN
jgi:hypothetical protein